MAEQGAAYPGENFERAEESARSGYANAGTEEVLAYSAGTRDQQARVRDFDRQEIWKTVWHWLRLFMLSIVVLIALVFLVAIIALAFWFVIIFVVHYTVPSRGWLTPDELSTLGNIYSNATRIIAPTALIVNAWFVAYFGYRRWRSDSLKADRTTVGQ